MTLFFSCLIYDSTGDERELLCPKCGCPKLWLPDEANDFADLSDYLDLGKVAQCDECKHEFTITENCWQAVYECD